jgi:TnpA family transposase
VPRDPRVEFARETLAIAVANAQILEVIIEIDHLTRFSWTLLGRPARSERELVTHYAGLIGLGSDLSAAELVRMVPALAADSLGQRLLRIEADSRLSAANDCGAALHARAPNRGPLGARLVRLGRHDEPRSDALSLGDAARSPAAGLCIGTYAHALDQRGILYDQPIVLYRRQAGPAIEGALRQQHVDRFERVAVDTHGFTHFAMALAKLVGFDLCPRLARLKKRKLYLPRGLDVPEGLRPCMAETVSRRAIARGWEGLLRLGASVTHGWYPATDALDRFGSAAVGDPVYEAGDSLGKLLRTLYLCVYFGNPVFRTEILDLLNQGEAVHSLQRAVYNGMITAKHGRTMEELGAISGALTLLANIVMAWNTHPLQIAIDRAPTDYPDEVLSRIAPIGYKHINLRGILTFDLTRLGPST